ncbi:Uncharacterised protein [BD1-7 clade bacterium]|nr:Uncharacterised protein [BD1-7 clade bacterium]
MNRIFFLSSYQSKTSAFLKLFSSSFLIRITYILLGFLNSVILARVLGVDGYGSYSFALSIVSILCVIVQFGVGGVVTRELASYVVKEKWGLARGLILRSHQFVLLMSSVIVFLAFMFFESVGAIFKIAYSDSIVAALFLVPILSLGALRDSVLKGFRYVLLAQLAESVFRPFLLLFGILLAYFYVPDLVYVESVILYYAGCSFLCFILVWLLYIGKKPIELVEAAATYKTKSWILESIPFGFQTVLQVVNVEISILLLGAYLSDSEVGLFRVAALFSGFVALGLQVVNSFITPQFSRLYSQSKYSELESLVRKARLFIIAFTVPIVGALFLLGDSLLFLAYGEEYIGALYPLLILSVGQAVNAYIGPVGMLLHMTGHQTDVVSVSLVTTLMSILLHLFFISDYGVLAAAITNVLVLIIWNVSLYVVVQRRLPFNYSLLR